MKKLTLSMASALVAFVVVLAPAFISAQRPAAAAAATDAGPFGALRWRSIGPPRGGRSIAVAGSIARPYEYYMGATGGGLWKSTDGGTTWTVAATLKSQFTPTVSTTVTGLKPNTNYLARVVGVGAIFPDSPSGTVAFSTAQVPPGSLTGSQQASTGLVACCIRGPINR